jgi:N-terminal domain of galactosyltransferase/N-terminal region of glycosyl transferase group 7
MRFLSNITIYLFSLTTLTAVFSSIITFNIPASDIEDKVEHMWYHSIIVPLRNRTHDAKQFMHHMIGYINKNFLHDYYTVIFIIQADKRLFNRGFLFNVGIKELLIGNESNKCVIFHDVDLLPVSPGVPYNQCMFPILLGSELEHHNWTVPYDKYCGGVVSMKLDHWIDVNGFSNNYHGWGAEDDDMYVRLKRCKLLKGKNARQILRPSLGHGVFNHTENFDLIPEENRMKHNHSNYVRSVKLLKTMIRGKRSKWVTDGINSVRYSILSHKQVIIKLSRLKKVEMYHVKQI